VALSDVKLTQGFSDTFTPFAFASQSRSETLTGWALGGGAETPITSQLTLRVEYIYYDLGEIAVGPTRFLSTFPTSLSQTTADVTNESIRIGLNWQF
jgi:outer membrane immunogenic protein